MTECLKTLDEIAATDPRFAGGVRRDPITGVTRPITIADHHRWIAECRLHRDVPGEIGESFAVGQNLFLYAWFSYPFLGFAQMHFVGCIEHSLRIRLGLRGSEPPPGRGFRRLLKLARSQRVLADLALRDAQWPTWIPGPQADQTTEDWFFVRAAPIMNVMRNSVAHGWPTLQPDGGLFMRVAADVINHLFRAPAGDGS